MNEKPKLDELSDALYLYQILATEKILPKQMDSKFGQLTPNSRTTQFLTYIEQVFQETGKTPRQVDLKRHFGISQGRVYQIICKLVREGFITNQQGRIQISTQHKAAMRENARWEQVLSNHHEDAYSPHYSWRDLRRIKHFWDKTKKAPQRAP
jgi:Mn-dependent DtxR family transcriptional regulator